MSHNQGDDAEYTADEYEIEDVDDDIGDEFRGRDMGGSDSDVDEYDYMNNKMADTSAAQARRGKDIQGIPWDRLSITREKYRQTRLEQYKNYENIPLSSEGSEKDCKVTKKGGLYYEFRRNSRSVKSTILHYQLRNLVWATSKHDVYLMSHFSVIHWSSLTCNKSEILNVSGHVAPCEKHPGSLLEGFTQTQVSTLAVKDKLLVAGGFKGELICKYVDRPGVCFCSRTTYDDNAITNAVEIYTTPSGAVHFIASNNDCGVRDFDMEKFQLSKHSRYPWPVNHTSLSPDGKLLVIVGDNPDGILVDSRSGKSVAPLCGHLDFSFASAWHPDGLTFATGNQDKTCRIWDVRNPSKSVAALKGNLGAIRSIRYSSDGRFMAMAEPADFVHVYDVNSGYEEEQEIDFFGEISGMSFSPDTESLFIGVWDCTYGSLLEFGRQRNYSLVSGGMALTTQAEEWCPRARDRDNRPIRVSDSIIHSPHVAYAVSESLLFGADMEEHQRRSTNQLFRSIIQSSLVTAQQVSMIVDRFYTQQEMLQDSEKQKAEAQGALATAREEVAIRDKTLSFQVAQIAELLKEAETAKGKVAESEQTCSALTQELDRVRAQLEVASKTQVEIVAQCVDYILVAFEDQKREYFKQGWDKALKAAGVSVDSPLFLEHEYIPSEAVVQAEVAIEGAQVSCSAPTTDVADSVRADTIQGQAPPVSELTTISAPGPAPAPL